MKQAPRPAPPVPPPATLAMKKDLNPAPPIPPPEPQTPDSALPIPLPKPSTKQAPGRAHTVPPPEPQTLNSAPPGPAPTVPPPEPPESAPLDPVPTVPPPEPPKPAPPIPPPKPTMKQAPDPAPPIPQPKPQTPNITPPSPPPKPAMKQALDPVPTVPPPEPPEPAPPIPLPKPAMKQAPDPAPLIPPPKPQTPNIPHSSTQTSHETSPRPRAYRTSIGTSRTCASHSSTQTSPETSPGPRISHSSTQTTNSQFHASFKGSFSQIFTFGGSEADTGNARLLGAISGESSSNRLSDGHLVVDFLSDALSLLTPPPYKGPSAADCKTEVNFAVAGATALSSDFFRMHNVSSLLWKGVPLGFDTQIDWFDKYMIKEGCKGGGRSSCKVDMEKSLFWIGEIGVSDYITALRSPIPLPQVADMSVRIVCNLLKTILDNGAKYVVVQGLPPVGCFPAYMSSNSHGPTDKMGCVASANLGIMNHNQALESKLDKFRKLYPNSSILYADYWNAYLTILSNAKKYHMHETSKPCCTTAHGKFTFSLPFFSASLSTSICKDPQNFISWDGIHLTEAMNKNLADLFLNQGFCKPSFSELVVNKKNHVQVRS